MAGKWWMGTRGSNPRPWGEWHWKELEAYGPANSPSLGDLAQLLKWAEMGQHVRLEFVPDNVVGDQGA